MTWIRCPRCRTPNAEATLPCLGCGGSLAGKAAIAARDLPEFHRQVVGDQRKTSAALLILGVFGIASLLQLLLLSLTTPYRVVGGVALVLTIVVGTLLLAKKDDPRFDAAGRAMLRVMAAVGVLTATAIALVVGLFIYLFVACATGNMRIGG